MTWDSYRDKNRACNKRGIASGARFVYSIRNRKQFLFRREKTMFKKNGPVVETHCMFS